MGIGANGTGDPQAYANAALDAECALLASTGHGRNDQTNRSGFACGQFIPLGLLDHNEVEHRLMGAAEASGIVRKDGRAVVLASLRSGIHAGMKEPRAMPAGSFAPRDNVHVLHPKPRPKLSGVPVPDWTVPDPETGKPKFVGLGQTEPRPFDDEVRRHVYRRDGEAVRVKTKNREGRFANWYRVRRPSDGEDEWDLLRAVPDLTVSEGRSYMTPRDAGRVDPAEVDALLRDRGQITDDTPPDVAASLAQQFVTGLSDKLLSYYADAADHAVVTPGVKERAMLLGATRPGSAAGELMRYVTQFKMWPTAAMSQMIGREIYMSLSKKEMAANLFTMAALSAAFGYMRMSINDLALGHPPRNPLQPQTMLAGLAQGGGLGIMGDFLFGETNRMGGGLLSVAAGPVIGDADTLIKTFNRFRSDVSDPSAHHKNGQFGDIWPDLAHFAVRHVPFANMLYLKGTLDYMLFYHLYEAASPGWWERTNRRLIKEQGRAMTGYTPGGSVPYGVPWLYMQNRQGQSFGLAGANP